MKNRPIFWSLALCSILAAGCKRPVPPTHAATLQAKETSKAVPAKTIPTKYAREDFELIVLNELKGKTAKEFIAKFGKPFQTEHYEPISVKKNPKKYLRVEYRGLTYDSITDKTDFNVVIEFDDIPLTSMYVKHSINP